MLVVSAVINIGHCPELMSACCAASVGVVIGLLLGAVMAVLLAVLVYRALKTKKEEVHHQRVPVNPTPVPVPDDAEHLVYNTTTKPL